MMAELIVDQFFNEIIIEIEAEQQLTTCLEKANNFLERIKLQVKRKSEEVSGIHAKLMKLSQSSTTPLYSKQKQLLAKHKTLKANLDQRQLALRKSTQEMHSSVSKLQEEYDEMLEGLLSVLALKSDDLRQCKENNEKEEKELCEEILGAGEECDTGTRREYKKDLDEAKVKVLDSENTIRILKMEIAKCSDEIERQKRELTAKNFETVPPKKNNTADVQDKRQPVQIRVPRNKFVPPLMPIGKGQLTKNDVSTTNKRRKLYNPCSLDYMNELMEK